MDALWAPASTATSDDTAVKDRWQRFVRLDQQFRNLTAEAEDSESGTVLTFPTEARV